MSVTLPDAAHRPDGWARALHASLILFTVAAPWSIAIAQTAIVLTALILVARRVATPQRVPAPPWTLVMFGAFLGVQALAIPLGIHPDHSLSCYRGSWVLLFPFVFWAALQDRRVRYHSAVALVASGLLAGIYGVVQHYQGIDWLHDGRTLEYFEGGGYLAVGNLSHHLTFSGVLLPILFVAIGVAVDGRRSLRMLGVAAALFMITAVFFSFSRASWLGAAAGILWLSFGRGWRSGLALVAPASAIVILGALLEPSISARLASIFDITELPRWRLWQTAVRIVADHPVIGAGLGSFPALFPIYKVPGEYLSTGHPHSDILNVMVETGIVGTVVWVGIWIVFLRQTHVLDACHVPWVVRGARAGTVALLVGGLAQCFSTDEEVAQVWFFVLTAALVQSGVDTTGNRAPLKRLEKAFKAKSLPLARRLFARSPARRRVAATPGERLLVVRPDDRLGNLILMTPFLSRLREAHADATIGMVVGSIYAPLLHAWPWVDRWIVQPKREHVRAPWTFVSWLRDMRRGEWTRAYEMSNHNTHSYYSCLLTLASGAGERIGFDEPRNQDSLTRAVPGPPRTRHFSLASLELLRASGARALPLRISCPLAESIGHGELTRGEEYLVAHVGGRGGKALPERTWRSIIERVRDAFRGRIVIIAGPDEMERIPGVDRASRGSVVIAPQMKTPALASLLAGSAGYVGCDSGVMHLAIALGAPTVALFFRSNPYHYAPLGAEHATVLLADPYGVEPSEWERGDEGMARSRLFVADMDAEASRAGVPATGEQAIETIASAISATAGARGAALTRDE